MQHLYAVEFDDGSKKNIVSDMGGIYKTVNRVQIVYGKRVTSISNLGIAETVNEHGGNPMNHLKAEIKHHVHRIEESVGTYSNSRNKDVLSETDAIRELCR